MSRDGRIAFTLGADLEVFNAADESVKRVDVQIPSDRPLTRSRYPDAAENLTSFDISPKGDRLVVVTRGEVFTVPVKDGPTMPVTHGSGARERGRRLLARRHAPRLHHRRSGRGGDPHRRCVGTGRAEGREAGRRRAAGTSRRCGRPTARRSRTPIRATRCT
jgi:hypothetical protein